MTLANPQRLFQQAAQFHRQGQLTEAERIYQQLIAGLPMSAEPRHFLGILYLQQGRFAEALELIGAAIRIDPRNADALANRGILLVNMGRHQEAAADLKQAVALKPDAVESWDNLGNVLAILGQVDEALASYDRALALRPDLVSALYNRATLLQDRMGRYADAVQLYDKALALAPDFAEGWINRGNALRELGRIEAAFASYERALAIRPDQPDALRGRAQSLFESGRIMDGIDAFMQATALLHGGMPTPPRPGPTTPRHKARHDLEQIAYLESIKGRFAETPGARLDGPAVKPDNRIAQTSDTWRTSRPQLAVIDDLLTPEALAGLRRFCLESPAWREPYPDGYLGAMPLSGFACPLLGQIAEEIAVTFPAIFGSHPLRYMWGFKYDSQLNGIALHGDQAAVNVNFWITPDDANLDPKRGGLVIWDVAAPLEWDFAKMNSHNQAIRDFLASRGAKPIRVPHRQNRAVIFDSDLFHETDTIRFKEGYLNRRINITMLYGRRERSSP
jgi:tetratricopeptide (TPR) repeat protein